MGEVAFDESGDGHIRAMVSRLGRTLIDARFTPSPDIVFDKPGLKPRIQVKRIPRADGHGYDVDQIIRNDLSDDKVHQSVRGMAQLNRGGETHMDHLLELGAGEGGGAEENGKEG